MMKKLTTYLRNLAEVVFNRVPVALAGFDCRKTISAVAHLKGWTRLERVINWLFRDPDHTRNAAAGWKPEELARWGGIDRSLW